MKMRRKPYYEVWRTGTRKQEMYRRSSTQSVTLLYHGETTLLSSSYTRGFSQEQVSLDSNLRCILRSNPSILREVFWAITPEGCSRQILSIQISIFPSSNLYPSPNHIDLWTSRWLTQIVKVILSTIACRSWFTEGSWKVMWRPTLCFQAQFMVSQPDRL